MRSPLLALVALLALLAALWVPVHGYDKKERVREGVRLHDAGDYDGAIVIYESILKDHPHDPRTVYELALSWMQRGQDLEELTRLIEAELASGIEQLPQLAMALGAVYDNLGAYAKGETALRRAIEGIPDKPDPHYNLGVNLKLQERWAEAEVSFQEALRLKVDFVSAWFGLGETLEKLDQPARALFAHARAAALEPDSERGRAAAAKLWGLMFTGVEEKKDGDATKARKEISITLPNSSGEDQNEDAPVDPQTTERVVMAITAATRYTEKWEDKSDAAFFADAFDNFVAIFSEMDVVKDEPYWTFTLPWFEEARRKGHIEAMTFALLRSAGDTNATQWVEQHTKRHKAYEDWKQTANQP